MKCYQNSRKDTKSRIIQVWHWLKIYINTINQRRLHKMYWYSYCVRVARRLGGMYWLFKAVHLRFNTCEGIAAINPNANRQGLEQWGQQGVCALKMGNVALQADEGGGLTPFQRSKLIFDFEKFFDLNKDGILTYKDFLWAKDRICQMSGWKVLHK